MASSLNSTLAFQVAVGVIYNSNWEILIAKRPQHKPSGGLWELPGGKLETGENAFQALCRELKEEIGITLLDANLLTQIPCSNSEQAWLLYVWKVIQYQGTPTGLEGQQIRWVKKNCLTNFTFPTPNQKILNWL